MSDPAVRFAFRLPDAPAPFCEVLWETEFSALGLARLSMLPEARSHRTGLPKLAAVQDKKFNTLKRKLLARLKGERNDYDWDELDLAGAGNFHRRVWRAMREIPFGETATYGETAEAAGSPLAFRACGQACNANRIVIFIPCHRVVAANGLGGFGCGIEWKKRFLALEK